MTTIVQPRQYDPRYLRLKDLQALPVSVTKAGQEWRLACPLHGGHNPSAFSVCLLTGRFHCFACGAKGVLVEWRYGHPPQLPYLSKPKTPDISNRRGKATKSQFSSSVLQARLALAQARLASAKAYLNSRGISYQTALNLGLGFEASFHFVNLKPHYHRVYQDAVLFPTGGPEGITSFYARGMTAARLHYLPPVKSGLFNYVAIERATTTQPVILVEGAFDALSYIEAGYPNVTALIGTSLKDVSWYQKAARLILAFDSDEHGQVAEVRAARLLKSAGHIPEKLPFGFWAGYKDFNQFWTAKGQELIIHWPLVLARTILI